MLTAYNTQTKRLLQNPGAPTSLYNDTDVNSYINTARGQLAGEGMCVRAIGTIATVPGQRVYNFSALSLGTSAVTGIQGAININTIWISVAQGQAWIRPRSWEWFGLYHLNNPVPANAVPQVWSQFGQGAAPPSGGSSFGGSLYLDPPPDQVYTLNCDCTCYPITLTSDTTVEAIPYLWTDAIPFFAAYYALLSAQTSMRMADAERYLQTYKLFVDRARKAANPLVNNYMYQQAPDMVKAAKLGMQAAGAQ